MLGTLTNILKNLRTVALAAALATATAGSVGMAQHVSADGNTLTFTSPAAASTTAAAPTAAHTISFMTPASTSSDASASAQPTFFAAASTSAQPVSYDGVPGALTLTSPVSISASTADAGASSVSNLNPGN